MREFHFRQGRIPVRQTDPTHVPSPLQASVALPPGGMHHPARLPHSRGQTRPNCSPRYPWCGASESGPSHPRPVPLRPRPGSCEPAGVRGHQPLPRPGSSRRFPLLPAGVLGRAGPSRLTTSAAAAKQSDSCRVPGTAATRLHSSRSFGWRPATSPRTSRAGKSGTCAAPSPLSGRSVGGKQRRTSRHAPQVSRVDIDLHYRIEDTDCGLSPRAS